MPGLAWNPWRQRLRPFFARSEPTAAPGRDLRAFAARLPHGDRGAGVRAFTAGRGQAAADLDFAGPGVFQGLGKPLMVFG